MHICSEILLKSLEHYTNMYYNNNIIIHRYYTTLNKAFKFTAVGGRTTMTLEINQYGGVEILKEALEATRDSYESTRKDWDDDTCEDDIEHVNYVISVIDDLLSQINNQEENQL